MNSIHLWKQGQSAPGRARSRPTCAESWSRRQCAMPSSIHFLRPCNPPASSSGVLFSSPMPTSNSRGPVSSSSAIFYRACASVFPCRLTFTRHFELAHLPNGTCLRMGTLCGCYRTVGCEFEQRCTECYHFRVYCLDKKPTSFFFVMAAMLLAGPPGPFIVLPVARGGGSGHSAHAYSEARDGVSRSRSIQVDATPREWLRCSRLKRIQLPWFRSKEFLALLLLVEAAEELAINDLREPLHHWTRTYLISATLCPREMEGQGSDHRPSKRAVIHPRNGTEQLPTTPIHRSGKIKNGECRCRQGCVSTDDKLPCARRAILAVGPQDFRVPGV